MSTRTRVTGLLCLTAAAALLNGCFFQDDTRSTGGTTSQAEPRAVAVYNPSEGELPFPDNLLFLGTEDGTLNLPVADTDPAAVLNDLHGFSSIEPWIARFTQDLDPASVASGVFVFEITTDPEQPFVPVPPTAGGTLVPQAVGTGEGDAFTALVNGNRLVIQPRQPMPPGNSYLVVLTNGLTDTAGRSVTAGLTYRTLRQPFEGEEPSNQQEQLSQLIDGHIDLAQGGTGGAIQRENVVLSWTVTTQGDIGHTLDKYRVDIANLGDRSIQVVDTGTQTPGGAADIYIGALNVRYGLGVPEDAGADLAVDFSALQLFWRCGELAALSCNSLDARDNDDDGLFFGEDVRIPVLMTVPDDDGAGAPYPVVIFQHGLTRNRTDLLAVADQLAGLEYIGIAIDAPLHGLLADSDLAGLRPSQLALFEDAIERTFNLAAQDGTGVAGSGTYYLNINNPLVLRDNLRQTSADLLALTRALVDDAVVELQEGGTQPVAVDADEIYFLGHSLGATASIPFLAREDNVLAAAIGMPGSGLARQVANSPAFQDQVLGALAEEGIFPGTPEFQQFVIVVQSVLNDAEPLNYASEFAASDRGLLLTQVVGNGGPQDQVLPPLPDPQNAPLSGSAVFATFAELDPIGQSVMDNPVKGVVSFVVGAHGDYISPPDGESASADAVRTEMRTQYLSFLGSGGLMLNVDNEDLVAPAGN
ncbi:dienelactone hydrolase [Natronocella acetinitrilica]|uniref:Dienelactone hydrolase n=1 Tax=Natronocella acetinitrilica TaxID=414046 RepID=A0AAE3KDB2_9GAMM|nr:hypothetical protein [Natronocella acetinitrilica]MCP1676068.1 dienelactone hydrolase [Natronocella acetinitrilica]